MVTYIIRRLLQAVVVLILISILIFLAVRFLPGNPILIYLSQGELESVSVEEEAELMKEFGLDKPLYLQYANWIADVARGDFGISIGYRLPVNDLLLERIPVTLNVGLLSFIISCIFGISFGIISAIKRATWMDNVVTSLSNFGVATPQFWLGILMIYGIGLKLGLLPIYGYTSPFDDFWLSCRQLVMPVFVMAAFSMALLSRQTRSSMLEVIREDYIRTAWAKGLQERRIIVRHALKNGLIPVVTVMGMMLCHLIGGSVIVENVFAIPGVGRLMIISVFAQDYQVIQACVFIIAVSVVFFNLIVDLLYSWIDPRIRYN
jgi:peptide/nickel transport system permease protein